LKNRAQIFLTFHTLRCYENSNKLSVTIINNNKKAVLSQRNRAMPQLLFLV